jgi:ankyrin repeat protein
MDALAQEPHSGGTASTALQEYLLTITDDSITPLSQFVADNGYLANDDSIKQLVHTIYDVCAIRPQHIPRLVILTATLVDRSPALKYFLLPTDLPRQRWYRSFLTHSLSRKIVGINDLSSFLHSFPLSESLFLLFAWFAPSLTVFSPDDLATLRELAQAERDGGRLTRELAEFIDRFDEMAADGWRLHGEYFQHGCPRGSLAWAIKHDDVVRLKALVLQPDRVDTFSHELLVDVNQRIEYALFERCEMVRHRPTLVMYAAFFAAPHCFRFLLSLREVDLRAVDDAGVSLARFAVAGGCDAIVHCCKSRGLDFAGAAMTAIEFHRFAILARMIEDGEVEPWRSSEEFPSVFHCAAMFDNVHVLLYCMENGTDVNLRDAKGKTALHYAAAHGQLNAVIVLIGLPEIELNAVERRGRTALQLAVIHRRLDAVRILLADERVNVNAGGEAGTALAIAIQKCPFDFIQLFLRTPGIDVNAQAETGMAALHVAVECGRMDVLEMLLARREIEVNAQTSVGLSGVHIAVREGKVDALEMLLARPDIDANLRDVVCFGFILASFLITFDTFTHGSIVGTHGLSQCTVAISGYRSGCGNRCLF